ncbi:hypothetical protein [Enterococcus sp. AZ172]|uniref:hypothetical protein n=1 Tax=unclassified Enterococcus TaxID=2608891 RepID=UPI003E15FFE9
MNRLNFFAKLFKRINTMPPSTVKVKDMFYIQNPSDRGTFQKVQKEALLVQQKMSGIPTVKTPYPGRSGCEGKSLQELLVRFAPQNTPKSNLPISRPRQNNIEL